MNKYPKRKYDYLETTKIINSLSPALEIAQRYNDIGNINVQLANSIYPLLEVSYKWNEIIRPVNFNSVTESIMRMGELISNSLAISNINMNNMIGITSVLNDMNNRFSNLHKLLDFDVLNIVQALELNIPKIESEILNNLEELKEFNWSQIKENAIEIKEIEDTLDEIIIDLNDNLNWQQKVMVPLLKFKNKNPIIYIFIFWFIINPLSTAINDGILSLVKGATKPIVQKMNIYNYKNIEKSIKTEVNNIVNINIESDEIEKELLKNLRYVSINKLVVRKSPKVKSMNIYILEFGQVVKVINKKKNWTLIEYKNEESENKIIQGWVFTRYLSRFK